jgi:hypothetical protein
METCTSCEKEALIVEDGFCQTCLDTFALDAEGASWGKDTDALFH